MDTENKNTELSDEVTLLESKEPDIKEQKDNIKTDEELKSAIDETLSKIRRQSMLLGAQVMCKTVLDKISEFERKPGNKSNNDPKRLIKDIKSFCEIGLSRKVNADSETELIDQTVQN